MQVLLVANETLLTNIIKTAEDPLANFETLNKRIAPISAMEDGKSVVTLSDSVSI